MHCEIHSPVWPHKLGGAKLEDVDTVGSVLFCWWKSGKLIKKKKQKKKLGVTWLGHGSDVHTLLLSHEAQHWEDGKTSQETGATVQEAEQERVPAHTHTQKWLKLHETTWTWEVETNQSKAGQTVRSWSWFLVCYCGAVASIQATS